MSKLLDKPQPLRIDQAIKVAAKICSELTPLCDRIAVAGSIRRKKPLVGDIDFVVIPRDWDEIVSRCSVRGTNVRAGDKMLSFTVLINNRRPVSVQIFSAHNGVADLLCPLPSNWGSIMMCRTGGREFNIQVVLAAKKRKMNWVIQKGIVIPSPHIKDYHAACQNGEVVAGATEEDIFRVLGMEYVNPQDRTKDRFANEYYGG